MSKAVLTIVLLVVSNTFMTFAWYGHLKFKQMDWFSSLGLGAIILISWGIAFFKFLPTELDFLKTEVLTICGS